MEHSECRWCMYGVAGVGIASSLAVSGVFMIDGRTMLYLFVFSSLLCAFLLFLRFSYSAARSCLTFSAVCLGCWMVLALCTGGPPMPLHHVLAGASAWLYYVAVKNLFGKVSPGAVRPVLRGVVAALALQGVCGMAEILRRMACGVPHTMVGGLFDNPIGLASACAVACPFLLCAAFSRPAPRRMRAVAVVLLTLFLGLMMLLVSRTALVATVWMCLLVGLRRFPVLWRRRRRWLAGVSLGCLLLAAGSYCLKKDSADGRLLVYRCSAQLIAGRPFFGHGTTGFKAGYMPVQAAYFRAHPDSRFVPLAGNVYTPLNDYLLWLVQYGLAGVLPLVLMGAGACVTLRRGRYAWEYWLPGTVLAGVGAMSLFSYPMTYPFMWWVVLTAAAWVFRREQPLLRFPAEPRAAYVLAGAAVCLSAMACRGAGLELRWRSAAAVAGRYGPSRALDAYARLASGLSHHPDFLYNYAVLMNAAGHAAESDSLLDRYALYGVDTHVRLLAADNALQRDDAARAGHLLWDAYFMAPVRFIPLYRLFRLYRAQDDTLRARQVARLIREKPVKVPSEEVDWIKEEAGVYCAERGARVLRGGRGMP